MAEAEPSDNVEPGRPGDEGGVVANAPKKLWWGWWLLVSLTLGAWLATWTGGRFRRTEPPTVDDELVIVATVVLAVLPVVVFLAVAIWRRRYFVAVPAFAALVGWAVVDRLVDVGATHWRSSRHAFEVVFAGAPVDCPAGRECLLGHWRVSGVERWPALVAVEIDSGGYCYAGHFLVRAVGVDPGLDHVAELVPSDVFRLGFLAVSDFYDEWYALCFTT